MHAWADRPGRRYAPERKGSRESQRDVGGGIDCHLSRDSSTATSGVRLLLTQPTQVDIYAVGEARQDGDFDSGWIVNTDTKQKVWALTWKDSRPAGGADKNRVGPPHEDAAVRALRGILRNRRLA